MAMFTLRHRGLIGGGKEDITHIAKVIVLNMVILPTSYLEYCKFCSISHFDVFFYCN